MAALHHVHRRKRASKKEPTRYPYPHPKSFGRMLDRVVLSLAAFTPVANIPQLVKIYSEQTASVSIVTWSMYFLLCIPWVIYGILHREKLIVATYSINGCIHASIIVGILLYS